MNALPWFVLPLFAVERLRCLHLPVVSLTDAFSCKRHIYLSIYIYVVYIILKMFQALGVIHRFIATGLFT